MNNEGYKDPTAEMAIGNATKETQHLSLEDIRENKMSRLVKTMKCVADLAGFEVTGRIELRDRKTGTYYR